LAKTQKGAGHLVPAIKISPELNERLRQALAEDVGPGDVTSLATIPAQQKGRGRIFAKQRGVVCGLTVARQVLRLADPQARFDALVEDGASVEPGQDLARVSGSMRSILTAERLMLNFLQRLSGVATLTRTYVDVLRQAGSRADVVDTRKTTPLWRILERQAVRAGGGANHRFALYDMYLIKNNHIDAAGGVGEALRRVAQHNRGRGRARLEVAVEARTLAEVREILAQGADLILLDNMPHALLRRALKEIGGRIRTEITGGVTPGRLKTLARLPVDRFSVGALTHSAPSLDISLHVVEEGKKE
jgi:nicotinate-nucleotide pyrophosphorylase (carboxylating)